MSDETTNQPLVPRPPRPEGTSEEEWANNLSDPANYGGEAAERAREEAAEVCAAGSIFLVGEVLARWGRA